MSFSFPKEEMAQDGRGSLSQGHVADPREKFDFISSSSLDTRLDTLPSTSTQANRNLPEPPDHTPTRIRPITA